MKFIGISSFTQEKQSRLNIAYANAFTFDGYYPFIIPSFPIEQTERITKELQAKISEWADGIASKLDALVLSGGSDINPLLFGSSNLSSYSCDSIRDNTELALLGSFLKKNKPVFGICRGFQLIGKYLGIRYFQQDIKESNELHNTNDFEIKSRKEFAHFVYTFGEYASYIEKEELVYRRNKNGYPMVLVNSFHHQGFSIDNDGRKVTSLDKLKDLEFETKEKNKIEVLATTSALIEAFQCKDLNLFAVQWHPEEYGPESTAINYFRKYFLNKKEK